MDSVITDGHSVPRISRFDSNAAIDDCSTHPAMAALRAFNRHLASRALTHAELVMFLASLAAFNRHTIGGIAILAGRLSDQVMPHLPRNGHEIGAFVLEAAIDEYGLRESVTHVELARQFAAFLGVAAEEVEDRANASPAAIELGDFLFSWYRDRPTAFSLGVHSASEMTSVEEFAAWHDIFLAVPAYGFSREMPEFEYMRAHHTHEPQHVGHAKRCIARYLQVLPGEGESLRDGMLAYLTLYQKMFEELDRGIFG